MTDSTFRFRGAHADGRIERGRVTATTRKDAQRILFERGLQPFEVVQEQASAWRRATIPVADLALTLRVLADMLDAGLPLARALQLLGTIVPPRVAVVLPPVLAAVREGMSFAVALAGLIATRATRGAALGIKVLRAAEWLIEDRALGALTPTNANSVRSLSKWSSNLLVGVTWGRTSALAQGEPLWDWNDELLSLIPIINSGRKIMKAIEACW